MSRPAVDSVAGRALSSRTRVLSIALVVAVDLVLIVTGATAALGSTEPPPPSVALATSVYPGHDGGAQCGSSTSFAEAGPFDPVTYCFTVANTGAAPLANIEIANPLITGALLPIAADSSPLVPGGSASYYLQASPPPDDADGFVDDTFINTSTVTATPLDAAGTPLASGPVTAAAEAVVFPAEGEEQPAPDVSLMASVYGGADGGANCPAAKSAEVPGDGPVTYCFTVTNTGNTHLDSIGLAEPQLDGSPTMVRADSAPLAPGASAYYYLEAEAPASASDGFETETVVTANSVDNTGADLVGLDDVHGSDGARVELTAGPGPVAVQDPPAAQGPTEPAAAESSTADVAQAQATTATTNAAAAAENEVPTELAFTGWESWLLAAVGVGLMAGGWLLMNPEGASDLALIDRLRFAMTPVPDPRSQRVPYSVNRATSATSPAIRSTSSGPSTDSGVA